MSLLESELKRWGEVCARVVRGEKKISIRRHVKHLCGGGPACVALYCGEYSADGFFFGGWFGQQVLCKEWVYRGIIDHIIIVLYIIIRVVRGPIFVREIHNFLPYLLIHSYGQRRWKYTSLKVNKLWCNENYKVGVKEILDADSIIEVSCVSSRTFLQPVIFPAFLQSFVFNMSNKSTRESRYVSLKKLWVKNIHLTF